MSVLGERQGGEVKYESECRMKKSCELGIGAGEKVSVVQRERALASVGGEACLLMNSAQVSLFGWFSVIWEPA